MTKSPYKPSPTHRVQPDIREWLAGSWLVFSVHECIFSYFWPSKIVIHSPRLLGIEYTFRTDCVTILSLDCGSGKLGSPPHLPAPQSLRSLLSSYYSSLGYFRTSIYCSPLIAYSQKMHMWTSISSLPKTPLLHMLWLELDCQCSCRFEFVTLWPCWWTLTLTVNRKGRPP